ncbi:MAG TPA: S66 peptidase family protein [Streptosporangiaceae bacterium]|nr:S66 peptidase family protein [Streptosporangiaceae bacterium]
MAIRFPAPLKPGDRVGVTSPSSGVADKHRARLEYAVETVRRRGYDVVLGECMDGGSHISAPAAQRAAELTAMLTDPGIRAVVPPWGGETAIDLLGLLDWEVIGAAEPAWYVGFSDNSTIMTPLTLRTGVATLHGNNLMDTPYRTVGDLLSWLDIAALPQGASFTQSPPGRYRAKGWDDWTANPEVSELTLGSEGTWTRLDGDSDVEVSGRLIGGCIETMRHVAGTPLGDLRGFAEEYAPEGLLVYVDVAEDNAFSVCRSLHGMRLAGYFDAASAVLVSRTSAPDSGTLSQKEAVLDALGGLGVPIIADVECGHVPPYMPIVNGALGRLRFGAGSGELTQVLT